MKKRNKRIFMVPGVYISFVKDYLPLYEAHQWMGVDKNALLPSWNIPTEVKYHYKEPEERKKVDEPKEVKEEDKKERKEKLSFTSQELKRAKQEDKESLKDVEKLEEHLEEDIEKAEKKLKK